MPNHSLTDQRNEHQILNRLVEISLVLNSSLSTEDILTDLMGASAEILNAESASVILLDPKTRDLHFVAVTASTGHAERLTRVQIPIDNSIAGEIVRENKTIVLDDVTKHPLHFRASDEQSGFVTRSLLGVPMRIKDRVVGALEAVNKREGGWTEADERYLEILASQAAIALEKAQLVTQLRKANEELSKVDKIKSDFIAIASHELRTPLGVILGYASFLKEEAQGELSDHATAVMNSALKMRSLIEDMTNLRLVNVGDMDLQFETVSVNQLVTAAWNDIAEMANAREHRIVLNLLPEDIFIQADRMKIVTLLTNVLNNAVRFTQYNGEIEISVLNKKDEIWIRIKDNGIGIPVDKLEDIFKTFVQVEDHMTRRHGGMGLGLSIAKEIAEAHKGRIWAESAGKDQGSVFTLSLPLTSGQ